MDTPIREGQVLESSRYPEPVEVIKLEPYDGQGRWKLIAAGVETEKTYREILTTDELQALCPVTLPVRDLQGDAELFFLGIEAHRLRAAYLFDPLLAVNVSQIDPLPHQIEAVYHYILRQPDVRFLLADDPGAGKTIMAGLLLKELKYRGIVHRTLLVVPGHLKFQWQREMKEKFGELFTLVDRGVLNAHWGRNVWEEHPQIITSLDFAKQDDVLETLREVHWDLVIVDEAHKMAAYQYGTKTTKTARYRLGELLSLQTHGLLFLTATPHRGDPENFRLFLDLLRPGFFGTVEMLEQSVQQQDNPLYLRRLKEDLKDLHGRPLFPPRHVYTRTFRLSDDEKRLYNRLTEYVEQEYGRAMQGEKRNVAFALILLQRRFASSIYAARKSLERRLKRLEGYLALGTRFTEQGQGVLLDEDELEEWEEQERVQLEDELLEKLTNATTQAELKREIDTLQELVRLARQAEKQEIETKLNELREVLDELNLRGTREKLLVFTESRDTLEYLVKQLRKWGYAVTELHGGMNLDARIRAEHEFLHETQVMVSTEAGGEGINLQFCSLMVNYDIPWNPNRLEQRMGRIHRYGQTREVHIYNLVAEDTREGEVLTTLFEKLQKIQEQMGTDRVFDVIGDLLEKSLKELIIEAITNPTRWHEIVKQIEATPDEELIERVRTATQEALATRHIDMQAILGEERRAREQRLVPEYVEQFFQRACQHLGIHLRRPAHFLWSLDVPRELRNQPPEFKRTYGEVQPSYQRITFHKAVAREQGAEFVAPGHPLLEAIVERLLQSSRSALEQGATFYDPDGKRDGWLYFYMVELHDGNNQVAAQRLAAIFCPQNGAPQSVNPSILWDLQPAKSPPISPALPSEEPIRHYLLQYVLEPLETELRKHRKQLAEIKRKYGIASLNRRIGELNERLLEYEMRPKPAPEIANVRRRKEEAEQRKRELENQIERECTIRRTPPWLIGVARVLPAECADLPMRADAEIEAIGMQLAMEYERQQGRNPVDVSAENRGYDIRSEAPDGSVRYIEVKARAHTGDIVLTPNEWMMAQRLGDEYWLYIITDAASQPQLYCLQNPAHHLQPRAIQQVVRYQVALGEWQSAAQKEPFPPS
jgi:superfamily II DNA or RNA helicase